MISNIDQISLLSESLGALLQARKWVVTTAESCTGGGIAQAITTVAGSSQWFSQGFITYSNQSKTQLLDVDAQLLEDQGAVSQAVVEAMVEGVSRMTLADCTIVVSGIAGPTGGTANKPVGTVWIAWKCNHMPVVSQCFLFSGDRESVRNQSVIAALKNMIDLIRKNTV